ncbi:hypothetical protein BANRA_05563 [Klebsiella pneumoniae]|nr:hypothetical protein BANRA_05563 [Klebsiella pneumoniae]
MQARAMISTGNYPQSTMDMIMENLNQASVQIAAFQSVFRFSRTPCLWLTGK